MSAQIARCPYHSPDTWRAESNNLRVYQNSVRFPIRGESDFTAMYGDIAKTSTVAC